MTNRAGPRFEQAVADFLAEHGFPYAERRVKNGRKDRGDIAGVIGWTLETKALKEMDLAGMMNEARDESANDGTSQYAGILKRRNKPIGEAYVVLPLHLFAELIREDQ